MSSMSTDFENAVCDNCKKHVPLDSIKYVLDIKGNRKQLCQACLAKNNIKVETKSKENKTKDSDGLKYYCSKCNYHFKSNSDKPVCGYCGRKETITRE
jgi:hypothetical protein